MTNYPPLPPWPPNAPARLIDVWAAAAAHEYLIDSLILSNIGDPWSAYRLQLTTGPEPGRCGDRHCHTFFWEILGYPGIDGPLLLCTAHHMPAPGWAYDLANWWPTERTAGRNEPTPCSCRPAPHIYNHWHYSVVRRTSSRIRIDPACPHHGDRR